MGSWLIAVYMVVDGVCEDDQFIVICFMTCEFHSVLTLRVSCERVEN